MTIRLYRAYDTGDSWTQWCATEDEAVAYLRDKYGPLTKGEQTPVTTYYGVEADGGGEGLVVDWLEIEPNPEALARFLNEFCEG